MKNLSILVAEDDVQLRKELVDYISIFIDNIYQANDGMEALAMYEKYRPNIIFTDINMPLLNGLDLVEKIRKVDKDIEIIIISAYTNTEYLLRAVELHLASYLVKPIETDKLRDTLLKSIDTAKSKFNKDDSVLELIDNYHWDYTHKDLYLKGEKVKLSNYELLFLECLVCSKNSTVLYEEIHEFVYENKEYSKNSMTSLVKRLRQKSSKNIITSTYKEGYKIGLL